MRIKCFIIVAAILSLEPVTAIAQDHPLMGRWARDDGKALVKIERCGKDWCAVNTWIKPGIKDEKVGDRLIMTLDESNGESFHGSAHDPQRKLTFKISVLARPDVLQTRGCVLGGIVCKTARWTRL